MNAPDCNQWDAAATAALKLWMGGGWQLAGFITMIVAMIYKPWFRPKAKDE